MADIVLNQGCVLIRALEALCTIAPSGPIERAAARRLPYVYKRRSHGVVEVAPSWVTEEILSASERVGDRRAMVMYISDCARAERFIAIRVENSRPVWPMVGLWILTKMPGIEIEKESV